MLFLVLFFCFWRPFKLILLFLTTFLFEFSICQRLSFYDLHSILTGHHLLFGYVFFFLTIFSYRGLTQQIFISFFFLHICFTYNIFIFFLSLLFIIYLFALFSLNCTNFVLFYLSKLTLFLKHCIVCSIPLFFHISILNFFSSTHI